MNKHKIRRRIVRAAHAARVWPAGHSPYRNVTALVRIPGPVPVWSPGDGWVELHTAATWVGRSADYLGGYDIVRVTRTYPTGTGEIATATVPGDVLGEIADKPRLHRWAVQGTFRSEPLADGHPALGYYDWLDRYVESFDELSRRAGVELGIVHNVGVTHTRNGHHVVTVDGPVYEVSASRDSAGLAWLIDQAARIAGSRRVRVVPGMPMDWMDPIDWL